MTVRDWNQENVTVLLLTILLLSALAACGGGESPSVADEQPSNRPAETERGAEPHREATARPEEATAAGGTEPKPGADSGMSAGTKDAFAEEVATPGALHPIATAPQSTPQLVATNSPEATSTPTPRPPEPTPISAATLFGKAGDGRTFSDPSLIGTPVTFSGEVVEVRSKEGVNSVYVLAGVRGTTGLLIVCESGPDQTEKMSQVSRGHERTFSGRIAEGHIGYYHLVYLSNCRLKPT